MSLAVSFWRTQGASSVRRPEVHPEAALYITLSNDNGLSALNDHIIALKELVDLEPLTAKEQWPRLAYR